MDEESRDGPGESDEIKVTDRRQFTREGEPIAPGSSPEESKDPPPSPAGAETGRPPVDLPGASDFGTLVMSLANAAMIYLGEMEDPAKGPKAVHLPDAQKMIDWLGTLQEKTSGNLSPEEARLLDTLLHQLRMDFSQKATAR